MATLMGNRQSVLVRGAITYEGIRTIIHGLFYKRRIAVFADKDKYASIVWTTLFLLGSMLRIYLIRLLVGGYTYTIPRVTAVKEYPP